MILQNEADKEPEVKKARRLSLAKNISFAAVFAALCCVSTMFVQIPLSATGYFNLGDVFVLLCGWFLGPVYGMAAAGIGSMLADILSGFASFAPATLVIKALDALIAYLLCRLLKKFIKNEKLDILPRAVSAFFGEAFMVLGYFFFEAVILKLGMGAAADIFGNAMQGLACLIGATILVGALYPVRPVRSFFPKLG